jgi:protease I
MVVHPNTFATTQPAIRSSGISLRTRNLWPSVAMVSARAWPDHPAWMRAFVRLLKQKAPVHEFETAA